MTWEDLSTRKASRGTKEQQESVAMADRRRQQTYDRGRKEGALAPLRFLQRYDGATKWFVADWANEVERRGWATREEIEEAMR